VRFVCEYCGKAFTRKPGRVSTLHCGKSCRARARRTQPEPPPVEGARWIALNRGFALVDADRFEELNAFVWSVYGRKDNYASRCVERRALNLHHAVLSEVPSYVQIDHINRNGLDCRRSNLRVADNSTNYANVDKMVGKFSSKYKGVHWRKDRNRWAAEIRVQYKTIKLGCYETEVEAAVAYDAAAIHYFGEFAKTNFPWREAS
jgi:hypothetical protein